MSTTVPHRWRRWWLIPEIGIAVLLLVLVVPVVLKPGEHPPTLDDLAGQRAARMLELASPAEHHDHGHTVAADDRVYCGVAVFGVDPSIATSIDDIETVYGYYFCAVGRPGVPYLESNRSDGPIVAHLASPPSIQIAAPGADYPERVRAMMPDQYEDRCFRGLPDPSVAADVKRRYESRE